MKWKQFVDRLNDSCEDVSAVGGLTADAVKDFGKKAISPEGINKAVTVASLTGATLTGFATLAGAIMGWNAVRKK